MCSHTQTMIYSLFMNTLLQSIEYDLFFSLVLFMSVKSPFLCSLGTFSTNNNCRQFSFSHKMELVLWLGLSSQETAWVMACRICKYSKNFNTPQNCNISIYLYGRGDMITQHHIQHHIVYSLELWYVIPSQTSSTETTVLQTYKQVTCNLSNKN